MGNPWMDHVKEVRKTPEAKDLSLKEIISNVKRILREEF